jgi:HTH domain
VRVVYASLFILSRPRLYVLVSTHLLDNIGQGAIFTSIMAYVTVKVPLSPKRAKLKKLLKKEPHLSAIVLAERLGCTRQFVYQMVREEGLQVGKAEK